MNETDTRDDGSDRVAEVVRRALLFVGPAEGGVESVRAEPSEARPKASAG